MSFRIPDHLMDWYATMMKEAQDKLTTSLPILVADNQVTQAGPSSSVPNSQDASASASQPTRPDFTKWYAAMPREF
eukprot:12928119-Prorocentrum_lima.AAC.1